MLETITIFDDDDAPKAAHHRVTNLKETIKDQNRVNVYIDERFFCSLDISQIIDLNIKVGRELTEAVLTELKRASDYGKLYNRALEYVFSRPHSAKEIRDYLKRKTVDRCVRVKNRKTGEYQTKLKAGYSSDLVPLVLKRLNERGHLNDYQFAEFWVENHHAHKGTSLKKLRLELQQKGVDASIIEQVINESSRNDIGELRKIITKKASHYPDRQKFIQYLMRQGFNYSDILDELSSIESSSAGT